MSDEEEQSLGEEIIEGLTELCETVKKGKPLREKFTVRTVELDLKPTTYNAEAIKTTRDSLGVSQAVFAEILAVSRKCVESWEQGRRNPPATACRLLDLINDNRGYWIDILRRSVKESEAKTTTT